MRVEDVDEENRKDSGHVESKTDENELPRHDLTEAERLRLVYDMITLPENEGGANISPDTDKFVDSIFALHNDELNKVWGLISNLSPTSES